LVNIYSDIVLYDGVNFQDHLKRLNVFHIFEPIFESKVFEDNTLHIKVIQYIVFSHSIESTKISVGGDRRKELNRIFKDLGIDDEYYSAVVMLENKEVLKCVQDWMKHQDNRQIEYLFTLQNAYAQQQKASLEMLKKSDGINVDYNQKMDCILHMTDLKKMIKEAESELQQSDPKMKEAYQEVKKAVNKNTISIENFAK
jgi:hypothetical protein